MRDINHLQFLNLLKKGIVEVVFNKVDGSERVMRCTLLDGYLPEEYRGKNHLLQEVVATHYSVWDLDANAWRSFRLESVKSIKIHGIEYSPNKSMLLD